MKKIAKILSCVLAALMLMQTSVTALAATTTVSKYTGSSYISQSKYDGRAILNGIDVSSHNGAVNWNAVKADGIDYAFIRVGYTGYTSSKFSLNYDELFEQNISGALSAGISVGVYWYSQALTTAEAQTEAQTLLAKIGGYNITLPVVIDYEFSGASGARLKSDTLTKSQMTANAGTFCSVIKSAGYVPCLYANKTFLESSINAAEIAANYPIWLAHYTTSTAYAGDYDYWQYTSKGKVNGITGNVDCNFWYAAETVEIDNQVYTGLAVEPKPIVIEKGVVLTECKDYTLSYENNINIGMASITIQGIGSYAYLYKKIHFKIVPQQVGGVVLTTRTKTSLSFKWNAVPGATGYTLYTVNETKGTSFTKNTTATSCTLNNLTDTNRYVVRIAAYNSSGNYTGMYSNGYVAHAMPGKVSKVKTSTRNSSSIKIVWSKKAGADGYKIYKYSPSSKKSTVIATIKSGSTTSYTVKGLKSGTLYYYYVAPTVTDDVTITGAKSSKLTTGTLPGKVSISSAKSSSKKKISVKWKSTKASGYEIQYSTSSKFKSNKKTIKVKSSAKSKTITASKSKKTYYVRVRAYKKINNKNCYGSWSSVKKVKVK